MRTRMTKFTCDRCGSTKATQGMQLGDLRDVRPEGWTDEYQLYDHMEETKAEIDLCVDCSVALKAVREMGDEMVKTWFNQKNERERSKTTT